MNPFDNAIYSFLSASKVPNLVILLRVLSSFGSALVIITILICIYLMFKNKRLFLHFTILSLLSLILSNIIKSIVRRPRPSSILVFSYENGYAFPNTPVLVSLVFYGFIIYLVLKNIKNKKIKRIISACFALLILLISISKISLGTCHATDVIGSFVFGLLLLIGYIKLIYEKNEKDINFFKDDSETKTTTNKPSYSFDAKTKNKNKKYNKKA